MKEKMLITDLQNIFGVHYATVLDWLKDGQLTGTKVLSPSPWKWYFSESDVDSFCERKKKYKKIWEMYKRK